MACNCKANEYIKKIHKNYGHKTNIPWKERVNFNFTEGLKVILLGIGFIVFLPIIFIITLFLTFKGGNKLDINKILKFFLRKDE